MNEERLKILQMVENGRVTADEAAALLEAISAEIIVPASPLRQPAPPMKADAKRTGQFNLGEWLKQWIGAVAKSSHLETFDWTHDPTGIQQIAIESINGAIEYIGNEQSQFTVHAEKLIKAPDWPAAEEFARQVQIHVIPENDGKLLRVYAEYPKPPRYVEVVVSFTVHGPQRLQINGCSSNGSVRIKDVQGEVQARSTNGEVRLQRVMGTIQATTANGDVKGEALTLAQASEFASQNGTIRLHVEAGQASITATTVNGSVDLTLPQTYTGQVDARTQNGRVRTAFQTHITQRSQNWLVGSIGTGGDALLKLRSQNGHVTLALANS
jgi:Putative adhesin